MSGILSFFNPCAFVLLPAYIAYWLGQKGSLLDGVKAGISFSAGFITLFLGLGVPVSLLGASLGPYAQLFRVISGLFLVLLALSWLAGFRLSFSFPFRIKRELPLLIFGVLYGLTSIACAFPIFLMILSTAVSSGGFLPGFLVFLAYSLGMCSAVVPLTVAVSLGRQVLIQKFQLLLPSLQKAVPIVVLLAALYLLVE